MRMAIHQPNLVPWVPFFRKMFLADKFCIMRFCQFEKNGFTNRFKNKNKWMTLPVQKGMEDIAHKVYTNGYTIEEVNLPLIFGFARMFGIDTDKIVLDRETFEKGTDRLIDICKTYGCDEYLANVDTPYLDIKKMEENGIKVIPFVTTNDYKVSLFEALEKWGIEGTRKMICRT